MSETIRVVGVGWAPSKTTPPPNPAKFSNSILSAIFVMARRHDLLDAKNILDPFAGLGRVYEVFPKAVGVEIEPRWADACPNTICGDSLDLRAIFPRKRFDLAVTSPCLESSELVLTADLRWVPAGDVAVGDRLMAFDEFSPGVTESGSRMRRKWRIAEVTGAGLASKRCVRVTMENGDSVVCSWDHPWLTQRYSYGGGASEWVPAHQLMGSQGEGRSRGHRRGERQSYFVLKQFDPWETNHSYKAGWLAGMFDGEGSLSFGAHGSPKLILCQNAGPVADRAEAWLRDLGYDVGVIPRKDGTGKVVNYYVRGGFPGLFRALGELRPMRLLDKLDSLDVAHRSIQPEYVRVVSVEDVGEQEIATITTSTGTYIGQGYLHHNTYGNRMADHHNNQDPCKKCEGTGKVTRVFSPVRSEVVDCRSCKGTGLTLRHTYRHYYGEDLQPNNSGTLQWGPAYQAFHERAWASLTSVMKPGGYFILNVSDHIRNHRRQRVEAWHLKTLAGLGWNLVERERVSTPRQKHGANGEVRVASEGLFLLRLAS